jgi:site-specific recombinase XerD
MQSQKLLLKPQSHDLQDLIEKVRKYAQSAKSPATLKSYRRDWGHFERWCQHHGLVFLPAAPETVALYIADCASKNAVSTITRRLTAITKAHQTSGYSDSPSTTKHLIVGETMKGIRRTVGTAQCGKDPLLTTDIRRLLANCPPTLLGLRDRALLLIGYSGAFRRSEISGINVEHISQCEDGVTIRLPKSKTDQEGAGRKVGIPWGTDPEMCPVRSLQIWLRESRITDGAVFRRIDRHGNTSGTRLHPDSIGKLLKRAAARSGMIVDGIAGHSLRVGHVTQAARNGVIESRIMLQTGHRSTTMVRRYIRNGQLFTENAAKGLGM